MEQRQRKNARYTNRDKVRKSGAGGHASNVL